MTKATNIVKRKGSANYYYRAAYPDDVAKQIGKTEFWKSLKTSDLAEARRRAKEVGMEFQSKVNAARRTDGSMEEEHEIWLAELYLREVKLLESEEFPSAIESSPDNCELKGDNYDITQLNPDHIRQLIHAANNPKSNTSPDWAVDEVISKYNWPVAEGTTKYHELRAEAARILLEARHRITERKQGHFNRAPKYQPLVSALNEITKDAAAKGGAAKPEKISEIYELYASEQGQLRKDTVDQNRKIVKRFIEFVGADAEIDAVSRENARNWKFKLREWPKKANEIKHFKGMTFLQIIEENKSRNRDVIDDRTVAKYLSALGAFGQWLLAHGYIQDHPTNGLMPPKKRRAATETSRRPFDTPGLNKLFASPVFNKCAGDRREHICGETEIRDDRYWLFLLGLFTGARLGELCQMRRKDFKIQEGIWIFDIVEDSEDTKVKSASGMRAVPLHPKLIEAGFVDYVANLKLKENEQIFARCKRNAKGQFGETSKWINRYLERTGVKEDKALVFHSLRHSFVDALRRAGITEAEIKPLIGHSDRSVTRGYGREPDGTIKRRAEMVTAVNYPGLVLPKVLP